MKATTLFKQVANNAVSTTATGYGSTGVTTTVAAAGQGALFPLPGNGFYLTIWSGLAGSDPASDANMEIVTVTARSTDTLTHSATTKTHSGTVNIALLDVSQIIADINTAINAIEGLTSLSFRTVTDVNGNTALDMPATASAVNYVEIDNAATGFAPAIKAKGTDTNLNLFFQGKGNGSVIFADGAGAKVLVAAPGGGTPVNYFSMLNSATGVAVSLNALGTDTNIDLLLVPKGTGRVVLNADPTSGLHAATKQYVDGLAAASSVVSNEVPGGTPNGSLTVFTTASAFATNSLKVTRNGQRLKGGGVDFTAGASNFTMVTAPATGDLLLVDYNVSSSVYSVGTNSNIFQEIPTGTINGVTTAFTLSRAYIPGSLVVYKNQLALLGGGADYTETTPGSGIFTFATAPNTGDMVWCAYQFNLNPSSNADTVDGIHGNTVLGTDGQLVPDYGGWALAPGTFSYVGSALIAMSTNLSSWLSVGDRIRYKQGAGYLYGHVTSFSSTQIQLAVNTDYAVANATITDVYFSKALSPQGFPAWFNYSPTVVGFSANPSGATNRFKIDGRACTVNHTDVNSGTSNSVNYTLTAPVTSANQANNYWGVPMWFLADNSAGLSTPGRAWIQPNTNLITLGKTVGADGNWTASGLKQADFQLTYEI